MSNTDIGTERFSSWLAGTRKALKDGSGADVPCGECTVCCNSSYFISIHKSETKTIASIPKGLIFAAPGRPKGNYVMGFNAEGHCPMFAGGGCSIYENRPRTCRVYDCRIFTAAGLAESGNRDLITQQTRRWKFAYADEHDIRDASAVKAAASFIIGNAHEFPAGFVPGNAVQQAVLAVIVYEVFTNMPEDLSASLLDEKKSEIIERVMTAYTGFYDD